MWRKIGSLYQATSMDRHWLNSDEPWRNPDGSVNYPEYINSQEWRRRRRAYLKKYALCNRCGMDNDEHKRLYGTALHVHHVSYARLGAEIDEDLEALCKKCHEEEECAEYDPATVGDHLAIELGVGERHGVLPVYGQGWDDDIGSEVFRATAPAEVYWSKALERVYDRVRQIAKGRDTEEARSEIKRLDNLERYATACLELACPEHAAETLQEVRNRRDEI